MNRFLFILVASMLVAACNPVKHPSNPGNGSLLDTLPASCPYLTKDNKGNLVAGWIRQADSNQYQLVYAVSRDNGKTFDATVSVPGSNNVHPHGENMPKLLFKPNGEIIAAWGASNPSPKNKYSGLVFYTRSFDNGLNWTPVRRLTDDTASIDQRYFDMALLPDGEAGIVWLDNRKNWKNEGSSLYYATTAGKNGFQNERLISGPCCPCCRTDLFVDSKKNIHVLYRAILGDTIRDMVHIVSVDNAKTFSVPKRISEDNWVISGCPHTGPAMTENKEGLHFAWFTGGDNAGTYYNQSYNNGESYTARSSVSGARSLHCQLAAMPDDKVAIVWNETFVDNGILSSRIGFQLRNPAGIPAEAQYISPEKGDASFPSIMPVTSKQVAIAYTDKREGVDHVVLVVRKVD